LVCFEAPGMRPQPSLATAFFAKVGHIIGDVEQWIGCLLALPDVDAARIALIGIGGRLEGCWMRLPMASREGDGPT